MTTTHTAVHIETRVIEALASFGADPGLINRSATLEALDIDSLDMVELGQMLHEEFGINLEPRDFEGVTTVGEAIAVIDRANAAR
jgi:acyl carrier protein